MRIKIGIIGRIIKIITLKKMMIGEIMIHIKIIIMIGEIITIIIMIGEIIIIIIMIGEIIIIIIIMIVGAIITIIIKIKINGIIIIQIMIIGQIIENLIEMIIIILGEEDKIGSKKMIILIINKMIILRFQTMHMKNYL